MATRHSDGRVALPRRQAEDWEDWECDDEDDVLTLIDVNEPLPAYGTKLLPERDANNVMRTKRSTSPACASHREQTQTRSPRAPPAVQPSSVEPKQKQILTVPAATPAQPNRRSIKQLSAQASRNAMGRISRRSSKRRQKPAHSKTLRLITDMSAFKRTNQPSKKPAPEARPPKFVDLAALAALEGDPTPASFGNWGWLRKTIMQSPKELSPSPGQALSPEDRPIMIGITLPPEEAAARVTQPPIMGGANTLAPPGQQIPRKPLAAPVSRPPAARLDTTADDNHSKSVWSPDTPDTACSFASIRPPSSVYSQMTTPGNALGLTSFGAPPVPALPANFHPSGQQKLHNPRLVGLAKNGGEEEDDTGTPCTLFEEDGAAAAARGSVRGMLAAPVPAPTPSTANSASHGWWDHGLVTPFLDRTMSLSSRTPRGTPSINNRASRFARQSLSDAGSHLDEKAQAQGSGVHGLGIAADNGLLITFALDDVSRAPQTAHPITETDQALRGREEPASGSNATIASEPVPIDEQPSRVIVPTPARAASPPPPPNKPFVEVPFVSSGRSTPTLRVPTPRRTPSPAVNAAHTEAPYDSLARRSPASVQKDAVQGDKMGALATDQASVDIPPPYSPPKEQPAGSLPDQAVFPPVHAQNGHGQPQKNGALGLASTMTSQGPGRLAAGSSEKPPVDRTTRDIALMISMADRPVPQHVPAEENDHTDADASAQAGMAVRATAAQLQSRFSLSPDSVGSSHTLEDDLGSLERRLMSMQSKPTPAPVPAPVPAPFPALPVDSHSDDRFVQDLEAMPKNPARAYLASEPGVSSPFSKSLLVRPEVGSSGYSTPLPVRPTGTYLPEEHSRSADGPDNRIERQRRRHEKEDVTARRVGGFWRGRGCISAKGCFGRSGREGRKKRRIWMGVIGALLAIIILAIILGVTLAKHHAPNEVHSIWVNLTDYPPMPTGVLTFVGPDNTVSRSGCTEPSTLWSCSLPKDDQDPASPYQANQPTIVFQIQWDNSTGKGWDTQDGNAPDSLQVRDTVDGFQPNPNPPSFQDMWFLGETTDNVTSSQKAGEAAPFFISILNSVNDTVSPPRLNRRSALERGLKPNATVAAGLPVPALAADGSPKGASMIPRPVQQPVRLYDRGLPTEHYGFYTYFSRSIFLRSVTVLNRTQQDVGLDTDGGCRKTEADFFVTWAQTRMLVQIWTRQLDQNTSSLLPASTSSGSGSGSGAGGGGARPAPQLIRPGTMPYPVTVTMDTHGGDPGQKFVWDWPMDDRQQLVLSKPDLLANNMAVGGSWINPRASGNAKFGGFDGGSGGCKCQWANFA